MNKTILTAGIITLIGISATGCVRHERYDTARTTTLSLQEQLSIAQTECNTATNALANRDRQLDQTVANLNRLQDQYDLLASELDAIDAENNSLLTTVTDIKFGPLPIATQRQLAALAATYPDDIWFSAESGMIRFGSDFTFSSGRANLKKGATDLISRVAIILNSPEAVNFEVVVMGHTDDVKPTSSAQRYPTNWELSTARAASVVKTLADNGVDPARFEISGYGEYRPLVQNREDGTKENRRVEIYLRPASEAVVWLEPTGDTTATIDTVEEPMK
ncbi:MAG: OmpA family protein [Phycisphaerales bacterium]|nr:OmpA family protein [Planctomycetota bacterium]MBL6997941.1 OmpA family protein [Phycisphaerales bacterium]